MSFSLFPPEVVGALNQLNVKVLYALRLEWPDYVVRLHTGMGTFNHFPFDINEPYLGVGNLGKFGDIQFGDGDNTTPSITVELNALDEALRGEILKGGYQGKEAKLYMLVMGPQGDVKAHALIFDGVMDSASMVQGKRNAISLPLIAPDDAYDVGLNWRCTAESHRAKYPGDAMYDYAVFMEDYAIYFGNKKDGVPVRELANG